MNYLLLFNSFQKNEVRYLICGGLAVNLHGVPRMTADIDIILDLSEQNIDRFQKSVSETNYKLSIPVQLKDISDSKFRTKLKTEKNLVALSFYNPDKDFVVLDVLIDFPEEFEKLWSNREIKKVKDVNINLVSIDDLIALKKYSDRIQDQQDIHYLSKIKNGQKE